MRPLLAWSQDDILAHRSGYHVLADYLDADKVCAAREETASGLPRLWSRVRRRFSFSRWCTSGSFAVEKAVRQRLAVEPGQLVHFLWCDRDLAFLDLRASRGLRLIGTFHQCPDDLPQVIRRPSTMRHFAAILLMSETQRAYFLQHRVPSERLHVVRHGVDVDHFMPASLDAPEEFMVLAVGGTRRDYAQMRAVAECFEDQSRIRFVFVGPEDKGHHFAGLGNVSYRIRVSDAELLELSRRASCFLHLPENATANNALLEAMACGAPVVSQRVGGVPEYVTDECAMLSAAGDVVGTVKAIRDLVGSPSRQQEMRCAARAHALKHDWRIVAKETAEIYRQAA
jgi:glycosyltransferase involved in cell wall biosynthesis